MKTKVFITGFAGMVGSHLTDYLLANTDYEIIGFIRWQENMENVEHLFEEINKNKRIKLYYGDINDINSIQNSLELFMPDFVYHLAAQSYPLTSFTSPIDTLNTNIIGTENLLSSCKKIVPNALIHVCSSSEVFGKVDKKNLPINEDVNFQPASPYAISKIGTDLIGRFYAEAYNMKVLTTRMFTHTGPRRGDVFAESSFAKQIAMIENDLMEPIIRVGNLNSLRTWSDVRDAVRAYHLLLTVNPIKGEYYNIGGNYTCTVEEMLNFLISKSNSNKKIQIQVDKNRLRPIDADLQVPDTTKFKKHTGWEPIFSFDQTMTDLLNYWRTKVNNKKIYLSR